MRWLPTSPRGSVAAAAIGEKCGYLPSAAPGEGDARAAVAVAVHDAALGLQAHRRAHGPQAHRHADHRRVAQRGDERGAARADGRASSPGRAPGPRRPPARCRRARRRARAARRTRAAADRTGRAATRRRRAPITRTTCPRTAVSDGVARQLARAQARAVDDDVGVELVEATRPRGARSRPPSARSRATSHGRWIDMSTTGATKRRPSRVRSQARHRVAPPRVGRVGRQQLGAGAHPHAAAGHAGQPRQRLVGRRRPRRHALGRQRAVGIPERCRDGRGGVGRAPRARRRRRRRRPRAGAPPW